ncbi:GIP, partial [Symbiodinium sp. CCMP2456]
MEAAMVVGRVTRPPPQDAVRPRMGTLAVERTGIYKLDYRMVREPLVEEWRWRDGRMEGDGPTRDVGNTSTKGPSERLIIPTFSGDVEGTGDLGTSARSYLRQIAAWEKMTKLTPDQRALVLYQNLQGSAWVNSESLCVEDLARRDGVQVLKDWITQHYLDIEVTQVGRSLSDLFRKLRRKPSQTFRDYTSEFNRASLDESTEVSLLASVGNRYALRDLQQAAIILDRSIRKPWERGSRGDGAAAKRYNSVNHTEEAEGIDQDDSEQDFDLVDQIGEDTGDLYITYMTAKARYRDATKARGMESHGSADRRGLDTAAVKRAAEAKTVHVTNDIVEFASNGQFELYAILDSACSTKSVVGTNWLERYLGLTRGKDYDIGFIYEREAFKFGAAHKIYESSYAAVILVPIYD